ncbi:OsmC family protein [Rhodanobacter geophilus]|uniref:OsmC family protein n=1 Tax=Rhodanobacter geophilus TaxID=3162488 RepID=A0ABV3QS60_9GAMM
MTMQDIASAMQRMEQALRRRPGMGLHDDAPAVARWDGGTRVVSSHANGTRVSTDMPIELGGGGDGVTPGWLFRAGVAACLTTRIAMGAAAAGIELGALEVRAGSRSDLRGLLDLPDAEGMPVFAGPCEVQLHVRIAAAGVAPRLRALVEDSHRCSPIPNALEHAVAVDLHIDTDSH